ncbi:MAG: DUF3570 domain-containing protein [Flavitalea sp.]
MKKIFLSVLGLYFSFLSVFSQQSVTDSSKYKSRKLHFEEANLVSSYYHQEGSHAAVTGGIGSQKLTDIANVFDIKLYRYDKKYRKQSYLFELGIDHYSSASSDRIDPKTISSASSADTRVYPSLTWSIENERKGQEISAGLTASAEYDYLSTGLNFSYSKKSKDRNGEFTGKFQAFLDRVSMIYPIELRPGPLSSQQARNTFNTTFSYSKVINQRLQMMLILDLIYQEGYLGLPFHRVYFNNLEVKSEKMPDTRLKIPLGIRANYFIGDKFILRTFYRYYKDDWGVAAHTANIEMPVKINPYFSVSPFYRFYSQTAADHFAPYSQHNPYDPIYTSNYDLSKFNSHFMGAGFRWVPQNGLFGYSRLNMIEIRYGHYTRSNDLQSNIISMNLKIK